MTAVRLAFGAGKAELDALASCPEPVPLLVAFPYLTGFLAARPGLRVREYVLDSGAWTAFNSGRPVDLAALTAAAKDLLAADPLCVEVFALDVIGDWRASLRNTEAMWAADVPAVPCYHQGEPGGVLTGLARDYPKIALGGVAGPFRIGNTPAQKKAWVAECFARVWPKKIHGFGIGGPSILEAFPFHSADASNWSTGPQNWGLWASKGRWKARIPGKVSGDWLRAEIEWYLKFERALRSRWGRELAKLDPVPHPGDERATVGATGPVEGPP